MPILSQLHFDRHCKRLCENGSIFGNLNTGAAPFLIEFVNWKTIYHEKKPIHSLKIQKFTVKSVSCAGKMKENHLKL